MNSTTTGGHFVRSRRDSVSPEKGLAWQSRVIDLMKLEHTKPEYLRLNSNGVVPTLVHDGVPIHESTLINEYLDEVFPDIPLMPKDPVDRARSLLGQI